MVRPSRSWPSVEKPQQYSVGVTALTMLGGRGIREDLMQAASATTSANFASHLCQTYDHRGMRNGPRKPIPHGKPQNTVIEF